MTNQRKRNSDSAFAFSCAGKKCKKCVDERIMAASFSELEFFDQVKRLLEEDVYENFMRSVKLFTGDLISSKELLWLTARFLAKFPQHLVWLKSRLLRSDANFVTERSPDDDIVNKNLSLHDYDVDFASFKRFGVSYRPLPQSHVPSTCTGRNNLPLCNEVLNDFCVSFPSWQSEDSSLVSSKKTLYEESIYRTEDERFELDIVIEVNKSAIQALENVSKQMAKMAESAASSFRLDDNLGAQSKVLQIRALKRIYGDKTPDILEGLMMNPFVAVPLVLNRLKAKEAEWKDAQKAFNQAWIDQQKSAFSKTMEKQWQKSKQNDLKAIRSKLFVNQIELLLEERKRLLAEKIPNVAKDGPLIELKYTHFDSVIQDVSDLLIFYIGKNYFGSDTTRVRTFLYDTLLILLNANPRYTEKLGPKRQAARIVGNALVEVPLDDLHFSLSHNEDTTAFLPETWYTFLRLHYVLVQRLTALYGQCLAELATDHYYFLLGLIKKLLTDDIDATTYEVALMHSGLVNGSEFLTIDKIASSCVKQISSILNEEKSLKAEKLYVDFYIRRRHSGRREPIRTDDTLERRHIDETCDEEADVTVVDSAGDQCPTSAARSFEEYEKQAKKLFGTQHCFKITFRHRQRTIIQSVSKKNELIVPEKSKKFTNEPRDQYDAEFSSYVDAYCNSQVANSHFALKRESIALTNNYHPVLLERNLNRCRKSSRGFSAIDDDLLDSILDEFVVEEELQAVLSKGKQRLRYVAGTFDFLYRKTTLRTVDIKRKKLKATGRQRAYCFVKWKASWINANVSDQQAKATEHWFTTGCLESYNRPMRSINDGCEENVQKVVLRSPCRPFSYRRILYVLFTNEEDPSS